MHRKLLYARDTSEMELRVTLVGSLRARPLEQESHVVIGWRCASIEHEDIATFAVGREEVYVSRIQVVDHHGNRAALVVLHPSCGNLISCVRENREHDRSIDIVGDYSPYQETVKDEPAVEVT